MNDRVSEQDFVTDGLTDEEINSAGAEFGTPAADNTPPASENPNNEDGTPPADPVDPAAASPGQNGGPENPASDPQGEQQGEPQGDPQGEQQGELQPQPPQMVDVRALQEARAANRQLRENQARLEERTNQILDRLNVAIPGQNQPDPNAPPDVENDPVAGITWVVNQLQAMKGQQQEAAQQQEQQSAQATERQTVIDSADNAFNQAAAADPVIKEAFDFGMNALRQEIANQGYVGAQAEQVLQDQIYQMAQSAPRDPAGMAEHVRRHARYWGWQEQAPTPAPQNGQPQAPQNGQPQPAAQPSAQNTQPQDPNAAIQQQAQRQEQHMSLSGVSGGEAPTALDAKSLAAMSDASFKKLMNDPETAAQIDKIMGMS